MLAVFLLCAAFALSGATDPMEEMVTAEQNKSLEGKKEELLAEMAQRLKEEEALGQEEAGGRRSGYSVENRSRCPSGWSPYGSRCFIYFNTAIDWIEAERYCLHLGANLASIHSKEEYYFVQELVRKHTNRFPPVWIGGTDVIQDRLWFWTDGSRFDFEAWAWKEPNNAGGREPCIVINHSAAKGWNDLLCAHQLPFVCAKRLNC